MKKSIGAMLISIGLWSSNSLASDITYNGKIGIDVWWGYSKVDRIRHDLSSSPSLYAAFEHSLPYLPNFSVRYTGVDTEYADFDQYDYTFYYRLLKSDSMDFDAGMTLTQYGDSEYFTRSRQSYNFDQTTFNWYASGKVNLPKTDFDVIGQFNFGQSDSVKSADFSAGLQYSYSTNVGEWLFHCGYRVIDLEFTRLAPNIKESFVFVDGWFIGTEFKF